MPNLPGMASVVAQLKNERVNLRRQLDRIDEALSVLGKLSSNGSSRGRMRRTLSAAARRKIAAAQRARWARVRAAKK